MAILPLPDPFRCAAEFDYQVAKAATVSPFSFARQVLVYPGTLWRAHLTMTAHRKAEADAIDALLKDLVSEENTVQFAAADFNRTVGPGSVEWTLDVESPRRLPRDRIGFSTPTTLIFRQVR